MRLVEVKIGHSSGFRLPLKCACVVTDVNKNQTGSVLHHWGVFGNANVWMWCSERVIVLSFRQLTCETKASGESRILTVNVSWMWFFCEIY